MNRMKRFSGIFIALVLAWVTITYAGFPTHPNQVGLSGAGVDRTQLPAASNFKFTSADNGKVITNRKFGGTVTLDGVSNIAFRKCWFVGGSYYSIRPGNSNPQNVTIEDCDFGGNGTWTSAAHISGLGGTNYIKRCFIYSCGDGIKFQSGSVNHVERTWIQPVNVGDKHTDCMQMNDGVQAKVYAKDCTFDNRTWVFGGAVAKNQEELTAGTITTSNIQHWGNSILQTKVTSPGSNMYISFVGCIMTGGNYIVQASGAKGEFRNNTVVRGSANKNTDLGLRNTGNFTSITGNIFHDNGMTYTGGKVIGGYTATPVSGLTIYGVSPVHDRLTVSRETGLCIPNPLTAGQLAGLARGCGWQVFDLTGAQVRDKSTGIYLIIAGEGQNPVQVHVVGN